LKELRNKLNGSFILYFKIFLLLWSRIEKKGKENVIYLLLIVYKMLLLPERIEKEKKKRKMVFKFFKCSTKS